MLRFVRSLFAWREVFRAGVFAYFENGVTGRRRAVRIGSGGYSPIDQAWLAGGR